MNSVKIKETSQKLLLSAWIKQDKLDNRFPIEIAQMIHSYTCLTLKSLDKCKIAETIENTIMQQMEEKHGTKDKGIIIYAREIAWDVYVITDKFFFVFFTALSKQTHRLFELKNLDILFCPYT